MTASEIRASIEAERERSIAELVELLRIPSVSADPAYADDVQRCADWVEDKLRTAGADGVRQFETAGHPIIYGEKMVDPAKPTVLVYGHYDVQPPDPLDLWGSPPFEPVVTDEHVIARGASDDKGQMYLQVKAFEWMMAHDALPCNVKFMIEGEEEVGSEHLDGFVRDHADLLSCDVVLISDTAMLSNEQPSITVGLRGLSYMQVEVTGPNRDLHSGIYGGAVANPINILCDMIASMHDDEGRITIPGFYDGILPVPAADRAAMARAPFSLDAYKEELEIDDVFGEEEFSVLERVSIRPTLDVNGIWGGYTGEGAKTVLPSKAYAKISMRLVPGQRSKDISDLFKSHFESIAPASVKVRVTEHHGGEPAVTPTDSPAYRAASQAMTETFGVDPIPMRTGGSIPIVTLFEQALDTKTVLMGFGLDSDAIHSPNERFGIWNYLKGIETVPLFFRHFAAMC